MISSRVKQPASTRKPTARQRFQNSASKEPVQVYCRLRPMQHCTDVSCMRLISDMTVAITPPESATNFRSGVAKEIQTTFSRIFTADVSQREVFNVVALPLVENLIQGRNGLLFAYGVTGSGKTYTMMGDARDGGIMPRCLDVLFNSIANYQAKKFVFKPDKLNGFDVQSDADAMLDRQTELHTGLMNQRNGKNGKVCKHDSDGESITPIRETDESCILSVDQDNVYAVFVTYVEIYNNSVYDLLDDEDVRSKPLQSKIVREDGYKNMYVHAVTETEVKSADEAFDVFYRGQRRRRVAHTALNTESSRSHSVFTVRLVQAPLDLQGEQVVQDKRVVCISQLSLVDLAGSERTNRTKNTGQRLREAGNINNSLMTLRSCLEILRENQSQGTNKIVPYRDSKLTHLFKNYFDGEGQVRMIVCANPRTDDYDETIQVMKFAEMTQEVQIAKPSAPKMDLGYTPGRRQANRIFKEARARLEKHGQPDAADLDVDLGLVYSLGGPFPELELNGPHNDQVITRLMRFLEQRIEKRNILRANLQKKQDEFRKMLVTAEQELMSRKIENASLNAANAQEKKKVTALEAHLCKTESQVDSLLRKLNGANETIKSLQRELKDKDMFLNQRMVEKQRTKQKYNTKIQEETDKIYRELQMKHRQEQQYLQNKMKDKENKLKLVKKILIDDEGSTQLTAVPRSSPPPSTTSDTGDMVSCRTPAGPDARSRRDKVSVANSRHRRSQSADRWVDHRPGTLVPVGTILQPLMHRRRSVSRLNDPKEITDGVSRYCLIAQEQDTDGELETKLYKGNIMPTSGGGAQVVFNDVECLKQMSPTASRKRSGHNNSKSGAQRDNSPVDEIYSKKPRV
ncbi:kinesin-like protein KIF23 [Cephus cinctus]|uniref:Kinesin-like protein n=1 Tax=Cephus cinctus TaxID=211228 RepID=A0AAJ7C020_CEPCN|nr:kinesin-like protein KIF23 [Cephus cinctus]